jgi:hypothetical protein
MLRSVAPIYMKIFLSGYYLLQGAQSWFRSKISTESHFFVTIHREL